MPRAKSAVPAWEVDALEGVGFTQIIDNLLRFAPASDVAQRELPALLGPLLLQSTRPR